MSEAFTATIPRDERVEPAPSRPRASRRWLKRAVLLLVFLGLASEGISLAIQHTALRRLLTTHLESAFGRPVEVGSYDFSLLNGLALEANSVTVGEDPRFGQEYFLRAESMTVRLRWLSLLRGRVEFGTLSLDKPSLNLVRNATGDWNLAQWLPQPAAHAALRLPVGPAFPSSPLRFRRVEVDGGRINFKNGDEKLPFAFVGVQGTVETDRPGRWRMNLEATPWRAAVVMQQAGTIHLSGDLGGTSSRLRPAALDISWSNASISDVLRLATGNDDGIRGALALQINARTRGQDGLWEIQTRGQLQQVHRWDLALRPDTPSLSFSARTNLNPAASTVEFIDLAFETPHSNAHASGRLLWNRIASLAAEKPSPVELTLTSAVDAADLLPWLRAFHSGVADNLLVAGAADVHASIGGWPPRVVSAEVFSHGANVSSPDLHSTVHLGEFRFRDDRGMISLSPVALNFGATDDGVQFEITAKSGRGVSNDLHISANVSDVRGVFTAAAILGWNLARGWDISGPVRADLRWQGPEYPWRSVPVGFINWGAGPGAATLRVPFLNRPIGAINAVSEWKPGSQHLALASADAFGAHWSGTFDRSDSASRWQFSLAADHLASADLDRWLNPAWRQSFLGRVLPFFNLHSGATAAPENLHAAGSLTLDQFTLAPLALRKLHGDLRVDGRHITFTNATGQFYGGQLVGSLDADLVAAPVYRAEMKFSLIDGAALIATTPALTGVSAKAVAGQISITATGTDRAALIASLACQGSATANAFQFAGITLPKFAFADASFSCAQRKVEFQTLTLSTGNSTDVGTGTIDFSRNLDLRFQASSGGHDNGDADRSFRLTGILAAPKFVSTAPPTRRSR